VARVFVDTNVLIYLRDRREDEKRERARLWMRKLADRRAAVVNLQVLNELTNWMLKRESGREVERIRADIAALALWGADPLTEGDINLAWEVRQAFGFQWFDCLHVASAHALGCTHLLSEDMSDGAVFRGLRIVNPFTNKIEAVLGSD
jgi:predicted nucleic acid-binding protein